VLLDFVVSIHDILAGRHRVLPQRTLTPIISSRDR
jgi:hypothetical protein